MKTALLDLTTAFALSMLLALCACGDDANTALPDAPDGGADTDGGTTDGSDMRDPDAMPPDVAMIPAGTFYRSYDTVDYTDTSYAATVSAFSLDTYEVTVARFRAFVNAGKGVQGGPPSSGSGAHANIAGSGWDASWNALLADSTGTLTTNLACSSGTWTSTAGANEQKPINCVTWYEAMAFCIWDGGYLPTEAEWNYAAAGGAEQRAYPWSIPPTSTTIDATYASYNNGLTSAPIATVGSKPAGEGRWLHRDLGGNVAEWTLDWNGTYPTPCVDCANLTPGTTRVHRGGSFGAMAGFLRVGSRREALPAARSAGVGVRCARRP